MRYLSPRLLAVFATLLLPAVLSAQTAWQRVVDASPALSVRDVAANDERFVAVGELGLVITSPDGFNWTDRDPGTHETLLEVTRFKDGFLALGAAGTLLQSSDGITWTPRLAGDNAVQNLASNDTLAIATNADTAFLSTDGVRWEPVSLALAPSAIDAALGFFFLRVDGIPYVSQNGREWQPVSFPDGVAAELTGANLVPGATAALYHTYNAEGFAGLFRSTDGQVWSPVEFSFEPFFFGYDGTQFVARTADSKTFVSPDGTSWVASGATDWASLDPGVSLNGVSIRDARNFERRTADSDWEPINATRVERRSTFDGIAYGNERWVVGSGFVSSDLSQWDAVPPLPIPEGVTMALNHPEPRPNHLSFAHDRFFVTGSTYIPSGSILWSSPDGSDFTVAAQTSARLSSSVIYANGVYLIPAVNGRAALRSTDGSAWNLVEDCLPTSDMPDARSFVVSFGSSFLAAIDGAGWFSSADGVTWSALVDNDTTPAISQLSGLNANAGQIVAWGAGSLWTSPDGQNWSAVSVPEFWIRSASFSGERLVAAGEQSVATLGPEGVWNYAALSVYSAYFSDAISIASSDSHTLVLMRSIVLMSPHGIGPVITAISPADAVTIADNELTQFSVTATSSATLSYQWAHNGLNLTNANGAALHTLLPVDRFDNWSRVAVKVSDGTHTVAGVVPTQVISSTPPFLDEDGISSFLRFRADGIGFWNLRADITGSILDYQWYRDGEPIPGGTWAELNVIANVTNIGHTYHVVGSNAFGTVASSEFTITRPQIAAGEIAITMESHLSLPTDVRLSLDVEHAAQIQWRRNGVPIPWATYSNYYLRTDRQPPDGGGWSGFYDVVLSNAYETVVVQAVRLHLAGDPDLPTTIPTYPAPSADFMRLANLSVRAPASTGSHALVAGFVLDDSTQVTTERASSVLLRAIGPGLNAFDVPDAMADPALSLSEPNETAIASNQAWSSNLATTFATAGAFALEEASLDAALLHTIPAANHQPVLVATVTPTDDTAPGETLFELYAMPEGNGTSLSNLSARAYVTPDQPLTAGLVITGQRDLSVLVRAVGDGLQAFGLTETASKPTVRWTALDGALGGFASGHFEQADAASARLGAFPLDSADDTAAQLNYLRPGRYTFTVEVESAGVVLFELYVDWQNAY